MLINKNSICYVNKRLQGCSLFFFFFFQMCCSFDLTKLTKVTVCHHSACLLWSSTHTTTLLSEWGRNHLSPAFSLFILSPLFLALAPLAASPAVFMVFTFKSTTLLIEVQMRSAGNEKLPQFRPRPSAAEVAPLLEKTDNKIIQELWLSQLLFDKTQRSGSRRCHQAAAMLSSSDKRQNS